MAGIGAAPRGRRKSSAEQPQSGWPNERLLLVSSTKQLYVGDGGAKLSIPVQPFKWRMAPWSSYMAECAIRIEPSPNSLGLRVRCSRRCMVDEPHALGVENTLVSLFNTLRLQSSMSIEAPLD